MVYTPPAEPWEDLPSTDTPVESPWLTQVDATLTSLDGASGRVPAIEADPFVAAAKDFTGAAVGQLVAVSDDSPLTFGLVALDAGPATADDTVRLNVLLAAARTAGIGLLKGRPGEDYQLSAPLVAGSGTTIDMAGCRVTLLPGSESHMVTNYSAANPVASATDGAVTSGSNVVTTALGATAVVGQTLTVAGAASNGHGPLIGNISARTATTITLVKLDGTAANATATVTAAAVELSNRDTNIAVLGGEWDRGANGPDGSTGVPASAVDGHSLYLKHVDGLRIDLDNALSTGGVTFVWPTDVSNFDITVRDANVVRTVCQVVGPAYKGRLGLIAGTCTDDLINLCGNVYPDQTETAGDVRDITIGQVHAKGVGASALKLNAGQGNTVDDIRVTGGIYGSAAIGVFVGEDTLYPETTGGTYGNIDLGHLDVTANTALFTKSAIARKIKVHLRATTVQPTLFQGANAATIQLLEIDLDAVGALSTPVRVLDAVTIKTLKLTGTASGDTGGTNVVQVYGSAIVQDLLVDGLDVDFAHTAGCLLRVNASGTVQVVTLRNVRATWLDVTGSSRAVYVTGTGATVNRVNVIGGHYTRGQDLVRTDTGSSTPLNVALSGGVLLSGVGRILNTRVTTNITVDQTEAASCVNALIQTTGATLNLYGDGPVISGTNPGQLGRTNGTEVVNVFGFRYSMDAAALARVADGRVRNNNAALSCGSGLLACDGTTWKHLVTGLTY